MGACCDKKMMNQIEKDVLVLKNRTTKPEEDDEYPL